MRNIIEEMLSYALLVAVAVFFLFIFSLIAIYGETAFYEPSKFVLTIEIIACIGILVLGIERLRNFIRRFKK